MRLLSLIVGVLLLAGSGRVLACSPLPEAIFPTNFELVELADAIVIATAVSADEGSASDSGSVTFRIDAALKGEGPPVFVDGFSRFETASSLPFDELTGSTGDGGSCVRAVFELGKPYVLFLSRDRSGVWRRESWIGSRDAEDYGGPDSLWVRAINLYLDIQTNPDRMAQRETLMAMIPELERGDASEADRLLAADIRRHLAALSPFTPTQALLAAYEEIERGEPLSLSTGPYDRPEERGQDILLSLVLGDHPDAAPLFDRILAKTNPSFATGYAIRFIGNNDELRRAFNIFERDVYPRLGSMPDQLAHALVFSIYRVLDGQARRSGSDTEPPWRQDEYIRTRWPEMALSLYWDFKRRDGDGLYFDAIEELRPADYRERPEVALALAQAYDSDVETWAISEVYRLLPAADWLDDEDPLWFPLQVLTFAFGEERDEALIKTFCSGETGRIMVVSQLGRHGDGLDDELLLQMLGEATIDDEDRRAILTALIFSEARNDKGGGALLGSDFLDEIIPQVLRGEPVTRYGRPIEPLVCPTA